MSIFDYFYDCPSKSWRPLRNHPFAAKSPSSKATVLLHNHQKQEVIARLMVKNLFSVDIQGKGGVGKTTLLRNLIKKFNTSDFLGVSVPSCKGTTLGKMTGSLFNCMRQQDTGSKTGGAGGGGGGGDQSSSGPMRKNILFCIDDVDVCGQELSHFIKFFLEHKSWLGTANVVPYKSHVLATTRSIGGVGGQNEKHGLVAFNAVKIAIDPIETQELTNIFKTSLKEQFLQFELDIQFLITKVIMASVAINKTFVDLNKNRSYFHLQDNMKIITGLMRAHKDCHDTRLELLELWVHEIYR